MTLDNVHVLFSNNAINQLNNDNDDIEFRAEPHNKYTL